jgi:hypothetical protein
MMLNEIKASRTLCAIRDDVLKSGQLREGHSLSKFRERKFAMKFCSSFSRAQRLRQLSDSLNSACTYPQK